MTATATATAPAIETETTVATLEARLQSLHQGMITNQYEAGAILTDLRERFAHGQWGIYLRQLCRRIGLSERAAKYYMESFEELQGVGGAAVVAAAKDVNLNTNKKPVRVALVEAHEENPDASPSKIANFAKIKLEGKKFKNPAIEQLVELRKRFPDVQIERVGGSDLTSFQVWVDVPAKNAPKGKGLIAVQMTADQLRTVKGVVKVGANGMTAAGVKKFLKAWSIR